MNKKYIVIERSRVKDIEEAVNKKIEEGYMPYGDLQVVYDVDMGGTDYIQAMVTEDYKVSKGI